MKDIDYVFEQNPDLARIGTKEQYEKYLKTIFPESKVQEIVYHGSSKKFEKFSKKKLGTSTSNVTNQLGFYFVPDKIVASNFIKGKKLRWENGKIKSYYPEDSRNYAVLLNVQNPEKIEGDVFQKYAEENKTIPPLELKGDSVIIAPQTDNILPEFSVNNYVVFNPSQIHILGSKKDKKDFYKYLHEKHPEKVSGKNKGLENIVSGIFVFSFLAGLFFSFGNLTGSVIGNSLDGQKLLGIVLVLVGIGGFFVYQKFRE